MDLAKLLPSYISNIFSSRYVRETTKLNVHSLSGQQVFGILSETLKQFQSGIEVAQELYLEESVDRAVKEKKVLNFALNQDDTDKHKSSLEGYFGAPCIAHSNVIKRVKDCFSGKCPTFLDMKPGQRELQATEKKVCHLCLLYVCKVRQTEDKCILKKSIPDGVICKECSDENIEKNVLLCSKHDTDLHKVEDDLAKFLPAYRKGTNIELLFYQMNKFKVNTEDIPKYRTNDNVFDVRTGKTIPSADVAHLIKTCKTSFAVYPTQMLNLGGHHVQVLWDTGAIGELVREEIASKLDLTVLDTNSQAFTVAGGSTVETKCPLYSITLGPCNKNEYHSFSLVGIHKISSTLPEVDLGEVIQKVRKELVSFPESKEIYPQKIGGSGIDMIIGIRQSHIFPERKFVLECGLQIWYSPLKDIYGSNYVFSGPIEPMKSSINLFARIPTFFCQSIQINCNKVDIAKDVPVKITEVIPYAASNVVNVIDDYSSKCSLQYTLDQDDDQDFDDCDDDVDDNESDSKSTVDNEEEDKYDDANDSNYLEDERDTEQVIKHIMNEIIDQAFGQLPSSNDNIRLDALDETLKVDDLVFDEADNSEEHCDFVMAFF